MSRNSQWIATQRESVWRENRCVGLIAGWGSGLVGYKFRHFSFYHFTARGSTSCMSAQRRTYVRESGRCPVSAVDRPPSLSHSRSHSPPCTRLPPCSLLAARVRVAGPALSVSPHARTAIRTNKIVCAQLRCRWHDLQPCAPWRAAETPDPRAAACRCCRRRHLCVARARGAAGPRPQGPRLEASARPLPKSNATTARRHSCPPSPSRCSSAVPLQLRRRHAALRQASWACWPWPPLRRACCTSW